MKLSNKILVFIAGLICILVSVIMVFKYENNNDIKIIVVDNKMVEDYAKKYNFKLEKLSDSEKTIYKKNIELFDFNSTEKGIEITRYGGISKVLVVPEKINSSKVVGINKNALLNSKVETLIISKYIEFLPVEELKNIKIKCYNNIFCNNLKENKDLNVEILSDSEYFDFDNTILPFEYNIDTTIEITNYTSMDKNIIIPETINGYEVKKVSLDSTKIDIDSIYIPTKVEELNVTIDNQNKLNLVCSIAVNVIVFIIFSIIVLLSNRKIKEESILNLSVYVVSVIYLLIQNICMLETQPLQVIISSSIIRLIIYLIIVMPLILIRKKTNDYDDKVKQSGSFIKESLSIIDSIDTLKLKEEEKQLVNKIKEDLKFSDPISSNTTKDIEDEIKKLLLDDVRNNLKNIEQLVKERNKICKKTK